MNDSEQLRDSRSVRSKIVAVFASTLDALLQDMLSAYEDPGSTKVAIACSRIAQAAHIAEKFFLQVAQDNCKDRDDVRRCNSATKALADKIEDMLDDACGLPKEKEPSPKGIN